MPISHPTQSETTLPETCRSVLQVDNLHFSYPDGHVALNGVTRCLAEGDKAALVGPNGAGKSTLMVHLNGILSGQGEVTVAGLPVNEKNLPVIRAVRRDALAQARAGTGRARLTGAGWGSVPARRAIIPSCALPHP